MMPSPVLVFGPLIALALMFLGLLYLVNRYRLSQDRQVVLDALESRGGTVDTLRWKSEYFIDSSYPYAARMPAVWLGGRRVFEVTYFDRNGQLRRALCRPRYAKLPVLYDPSDGDAFWSDDAPLDSEGHPNAAGRAGQGGTNLPAPATTTEATGDLATRIKALRTENARLRLELEKLEKRR